MQAPQYPVPIRNPSKKQKRKPEPSESLNSADLEKKREQVQLKLEASKKNLKLSTSWDREHYEAREEDENLNAEYQQVNLKLSYANLKQSEPETTMEEYMNTDEAKEMLVKQLTSESQAQVWRRQSKLLNNDDGPSTPAGIQTSKLGLNTGTYHASRSSEDQSQLLLDCVKVYGAAHPNPKTLKYWCPISKAWHNQLATTASHIYPVKSGAEGFEALFDSEVANELMSTSNCMLLVTQVERMFDSHRLALVPDVKDLSNREEMTAWYNTVPQEYAIRVFDSGSKGMDDEVPERDITFAQLDGEKVQWRTDARPRRRYLWFHYACCVLKEARGSPLPDEFQAEYEKKYWGSLGKWFKTEGYLIGAVQLLGQDYKPLLLPSDATVDETKDEDLSLVQAMNESIQNGMSLGKADEDEESDEEFEEFGE